MTVGDIYTIYRQGESFVYLLDFKPQGIILDEI
nr:MAG TPA: alpha-L-arabinofuranosidase [Caudoviricetes sp.]